jgi:hypothetical protein
VWPSDQIIACGLFCRSFNVFFPHIYVVRARRRDLVAFEDR